MAAKKRGCLGSIKYWWASKMAALHMSRFSGRHFYRSLLILGLLGGVGYPIMLLYNSFAFRPTHEYVTHYNWNATVAPPAQLTVNLQGSVLLLAEGEATQQEALKIETFHTFAQMTCSNSTSNTTGTTQTTCKAVAFGSDCNVVKVDNTYTVSGSHSNEDVITPNFCQLRVMVKKGVTMPSLAVDGIGVAYFTTEHDPSKVINFGGNSVTVTGQTCDTELSYLNLNSISVRTGEGIIDLQEVNFNSADLASTLNSIVVSTANSLDVTYQSPRQVICLHGEGGLDVSTCNATIGNSTSCTANSYLYNGGDVTVLAPTSTAPARKLNANVIAGDIAVRVGSATAYSRVGPDNNGLVVPALRDVDQRRISAIFSSDTNQYDIVRFEVRGAGTPGGLFSWAKKRAFLAIDPALLAVVSADLLTPRRLHMKVYMSPGFCPVDRVAAGVRQRIIDEKLHMLGIEEWSAQHPDSRYLPQDEVAKVRPRPAVELLGTSSDSTPLRLLATPAEALQVSRQTQVFAEIDRVLDTVTNLEDGVIAYQHSCEKMQEFVVSPATGGYEKKTVHWSADGSILAILIFALLISAVVGTGTTFTIFHFMTKSMDDQRSHLKEQLIQLRTQGVFPLENGWYAFFPWPYSFYPSGPRPTKTKTQKDVHQKSVAEALAHAEQVDEKYKQRNKEAKKELKRGSSVFSSPFKKSSGASVNGNGSQDQGKVAGKGSSGDGSEEQGTGNTPLLKKDGRDDRGDGRRDDGYDDYSDYGYSDYGDDGAGSSLSSSIALDDGGGSEDYSEESDVSTGRRGGGGRGGGRGGRSDAPTSFRKSLPFGLGDMLPSSDDERMGTARSAADSGWFSGFFGGDSDADRSDSDGDDKTKKKSKDPEVVEPGAAIAIVDSDDESEGSEFMFGMFNFAGKDNTNEGFFSSLFSGQQSEEVKKKKKKGLFGFLGSTEASESEDLFDEEEEEEEDFEFDTSTSDDDDDSDDIWGDDEDDFDLSSDWSEFDEDLDVGDDDFAFGGDDDMGGAEEEPEDEAAVLMAGTLKLSKSGKGRAGKKRARTMHDQMLPNIDMAKWYFKVKVPSGANAALENPDIRVFKSCLTRDDGGRNTDLLRALLTQTHQSLPFRALGQERAEKVLQRIWDKALKNYLIERQAEESEANKEEPLIAGATKREDHHQPDLVDPRLVAPAPKPESIDTAHYREEDQKSRPYSKELKYIDTYIGPFTLVEIFIDAMADQLEEVLAKGKNLGIGVGDVMSFVSENKRLMKDPSMMAERTLNFILREVMELLLEILGVQDKGQMQNQLVKTPLPTDKRLKEMPEWLKENADAILHEIVRQVSEEFAILARKSTLEFKKVVVDCNLMCDNLKELLKDPRVSIDNDKPVLDCIKLIGQAGQIVQQLTSAVYGAMDNGERVVFWVREITMQSLTLRSKIMKDLRDPNMSKRDYPVVSWVGQVNEIKTNAQAARRNIMECVKRIRAAKEALAIGADGLAAHGTSIFKKVQDLVQTKIADAVLISNHLLGVKDQVLKKYADKEKQWRGMIKKLGKNPEARKLEKKIEGLAELRQRWQNASAYQARVEATVERFKTLPIVQDLQELKSKLILEGKVTPKDQAKGLSRFKQALGVWASHTILVVMNFIMLLIPTVPLVTGLILVQKSYGRDPEQNICFGSGLRVISTLLASFCLVYYAIGVIKLWFFFTDANSKGRMIWRKVFYISATVFLVTSCSWFFFFISWVILGLVFKPERAIPYVVALGSLGSYVMLQAKRAKDIRQRLYVNVKQRIHDSLEELHLTATLQEQKNFLMRAFSMVGLSKETVLVKLLGVVTGLIVVFAFIFLGMSVFQSPGAVSAAIGSVLSGVAGGATMLLGRKSDTDLDNLVNKAEELVSKGIDITLNELKKREDEVRKLEVIRVLGTAVDVYTTMVGSGEKTKVKLFPLLETIHYPTNEPPHPCRSSCRESCHHGSKLVGSARYIWDGLRATGYGARIWADDNKKTPGQMAIWITRGEDLEGRKEWVSEQLVRIESEFHAKQEQMPKKQPFEMPIWWPSRKDDTKKVETLTEEKHYEGDLEHGSTDGVNLLKREAKDLWVTLEAQGFPCRINEAAADAGSSGKKYQIVISGVGTKEKGGAAAAAASPEKKGKKKDARATIADIVARVTEKAKMWKKLEEAGETHIVALKLKPEHCIAGKPPPRLGRNPDRLVGDAKIIWNALSIRGFNAVIDFASTGTDPANVELSRAIVVKPPFKVLDQEALDEKRKEQELLKAEQNGKGEGKGRRDDDSYDSRDGRRSRRSRSRSRRRSYDSYSDDSRRGRRR